MELQKYDDKGQFLVEKTDLETKIFGTFDKIFEKKWEKWNNLCNSLNHTILFSVAINQL